jgi:hypothetical protein
LDSNRIPHHLGSLDFAHRRYSLSPSFKRGYVPMEIVADEFSCWKLLVFSLLKDGILGEPTRREDLLEFSLF